MAAGRPSLPPSGAVCQANAVRKQHVGDAVHLRGLIEISNHCERQCMYCGLRRANRASSATA